MLKKQEKRKTRHRRVRAKVKGTLKVPRLCVFRSNKYIYVQLINDQTGKTLASASAKLSEAEKLGSKIAKKAVDKKINKVVFDRGGYKYHGRIRALAESARKAGLIF